MARLIVYKNRYDYLPDSDRYGFAVIDKGEEVEGMDAGFSGREAVIQYLKDVTIRYAAYIQADVLDLSDENKDWSIYRELCDEEEPTVAGFLEDIKGRFLLYRSIPCIKKNA